MAAASPSPLCAASAFRCVRATKLGAGGRGRRGLETGSFPGTLAAAGLHCLAPLRASVRRRRNTGVAAFVAFAYVLFDYCAGAVSVCGKKKGGEKLLIWLLVFGAKEKSCSQEISVSNDVRHKVSTARERVAGHRLRQKGAVSCAT